MTFNGTGGLTLSGSNTVQRNYLADEGNAYPRQFPRLQNSTLSYTGGTLSFGTLTAATLGSLSSSQNIALKNASNAAVALTMGGTGSSTYTGILSSTGSLTYSGTGSQTLSGANTYSGGTAVASGTLVASGTALGTGAASVASGATLSVGEAVNSTLTARSVGSLSASSLTVTSLVGNTTPLLTFNLGASGTSDLLTLTASSSPLTFSGAGEFVVGFATATGGSLGSGTYSLLSFSTPQTVASLPSVSNYTAKAKGNLSALNGGQFAYVTNSGGQVTGSSTRSPAPTPRPNRRGNAHSGRRERCPRFCPSPETMGRKFSPEPARLIFGYNNRTYLDRQEI